MIFQRISLAAVLSLMLLASGCLPSPYYQKNVAVPGNEWSYTFTPSFSFDIQDTSALYDTYFIIRHTEMYPFSNIWLQIQTKAPGDTSFETTRIELPLSDPDGKWLGRGMGDVYEQRLAVTRPVSGNQPYHQYAKKGTYTIRLQQDMRVNPLPQVMHIGMRIEKVGNLR